MASDALHERTPDWWDAVDVSPIRPAPASDPVAQAGDRIGLACSLHRAAGGVEHIAHLLGNWCLDLRRTPHVRTTIEAILRQLDALERQACEPQSWQHLAAAETALAAYLGRQA